MECVSHMNRQTDRGLKITSQRETLRPHITSQRGLTKEYALDMHMKIIYL